MTGIAAMPENSWRRTLRDPALFAAVLILWALPALFIQLPLAGLPTRTVHFSPQGIQPLREGQT